MMALDFACSYQHPTELWNCGSVAGQPCTMVSQLGTRMNLRWFHAERMEAVAAMASPSTQAPTVEEFDNAVEGLDIV